MVRPAWTSVLNRTVIISALGYFVDIYDLLLFSIVRQESLAALGVAGADQLDVGIRLLNWQMVGLLLGGIAWGVLGDKKGRVSVLFGSIFLYSIANIANAFVGDLPTLAGWGVLDNYALLRFVAGVGLAGELGVAVTLVTEVLPRETRSYGTAIVTGVGILGAGGAYVVGKLTDWSMAFLVGGLLGLVLLAARFSLVESGMYQSIASSSATARRGDLVMLFNDWDRFSRYVYSLLVGLPVWFVIGVLITFAPEMAAPLAVKGTVRGADAILFCYLGAALGGLVTGILAQVWQSRRLVLTVSLALVSALIYVYVFTSGLPAWAFYTLCFFLGLGSGYWAVFVTNAAEQFGTNLRATVATTAPNFVRGALVPLTFAFRALADRIGLVEAAMVVGQVAVLLALLAVRQLRETSGKNLDFVEGDGRPGRAASRAAQAARSI